MAADRSSDRQSSMARTRTPLRFCVHCVTSEGPKAERLQHHHTCTHQAAFRRQAEEYIDERHRHRYEVNPEMVEDLEAAGLRFVGRDETGTRMEIVELAPELEHPFFVGSQFHPEVGPEPCLPWGGVRAQHVRRQATRPVHQGCFSVSPSKLNRLRTGPQDRDYLSTWDWAEPLRTVTGCDACRVAQVPHRDYRWWCLHRFAHWNICPAGLMLVAVISEATLAVVFILHAVCVMTWRVGSQFKSRPRKPSPLFLGLCLAASGKLAGHSFSPVRT